MKMKLFTITLLLVLINTGCNSEKHVEDRSTTAPVQTAEAAAPSQSSSTSRSAQPATKRPTPEAPVQAQTKSQSQLMGEPRTDAVDASTVPDPTPPVPVEQIEGSWRLVTDRTFKAYVFVEKIFYDKGLTEVSFPDGRVMLLSCRLGGAWLTNPEKHPRAYVDDWNRNHSWQTCASLPPHTWIRIAVSKELFKRGKNASYDVWGIEFYPRPESDLFYRMSVEAICDDLRSETCKTAKVASEEYEENDAAQRRAGRESPQ